MMLGGIAIPHDRGLAGHSDADVVLHAITDALLGAAGARRHRRAFPAVRPAMEGRRVGDFPRPRRAAWSAIAGGIIDFVDCTVICRGAQGRARTARRCVRRIAAILGLAERQVSIKATTTERLGFTGRREGIAAQAVATIRMETGAMSEYLLPAELVDKAREVVEANRAAGRTRRGRRKLHRRAGQRRDHRDPRLVGHVRGRLRHLFERRQDRPRCSVSEDVVETFGAVSVATAWAMARGALEASDADVAVAITGIAGPDGGTAAEAGRDGGLRARRDATPARRRSSPTRNCSMPAAAARACGFRRRFARSTC